MSLPTPTLLSRFNPSHWSTECWSLSYLRNRIRSALYRRRNPGDPWLTPDAIAFLRRRITHQTRVLEFGSGVSTLWFAARSGRIESIEHQESWSRGVAESIRNAGLEEFAAVHHAPPERYAEAAHGFADQSFDIVVVDAIRRADCVIAALPKLRPGGWLVIDNANRHLPGKCPGPASLRRFDLADPEQVKWRDLQERFAAWEQVLTSNGIWETLLLRKPA